MKPVQGVLITRPQQDAEQLARLLSAADIHSCVQPLVKIAPGRQLSQLEGQLQRAQIVIAVSKHAIFQAQQAKVSWPAHAQYLAVGSATRHAWQQSHQHPISIPKQHTSEGLLQMPQLKSVNSANILILRGQSGRELLAQTLTHKGANVSYCECYQRQLIPLNGTELLQEWHSQNISHWVVSSKEQLQRVEQLCPSTEKAWLKQKTLVTISARLTQAALSLGYSRVIESSAASNTELAQTLIALNSE